MIEVQPIFIVKKSPAQRHDFIGSEFRDKHAIRLKDGNLNTLIAGTRKKII